jgi:hypothetical protein
VTANHTIAASFAIDTFTITASTGANGTIAPSGIQTVNYGTNQAFTITPSTGYHVLDVLVDGVSVGTVTSYTFSNVTANHTIAASFAIDTFTITASAGSNGTIAPSGIQTVDYGTSQAFTIAPSTGYHVLDVLVDGVSVGAVTSYTFTNVTANHTISASFAIDIPAPPVLIAPANAAVNISTSPTLSWNVSTGAASYRLQVSLTPDFATTVYDNSTLTGTSQRITGLAGTTSYYWRVNATNVSGTSAYSTVRNFTTGQAPIILATAGRFAVLSDQAITNTPTSAITGDVGLSPITGGAITGLSSGEVTGTIYAVDAAGPAGSTAAPAMLLVAKNDATNARTDGNAAGRGTPIPLLGNLAAQTLYPGLYSQGTIDLSVGGTVTLDAQGDSSAVFIIRASTTILLNDNSEVLLTNQAQARNIFWVAGTTVTLNTASKMKGTIIANTFYLLAGARLDGRALVPSGGAAVTLIQNTIALPTQ